MSLKNKILGRTCWADVAAYEEFERERELQDVQQGIGCMTLGQAATKPLPGSAAEAAQQLKALRRCVRHNSRQMEQVLADKKALVQRMEVAAAEVLHQQLQPHAPHALHPQQEREHQKMLQRVLLQPRPADSMEAALECINPFMPQYLELSRRQTRIDWDLIVLLRQQEAIQRIWQQAC